MLGILVLNLALTAVCLGLSLGICRAVRRG